MNTQLEALAPVRNALLAGARAEAAHEVAEARRQADDQLARAHARARAILDEAASAGRSDAAMQIAAERDHARRTARALELAAQREIYDELGRQVVAHVARLLADPAMRDRLVATIHAELGPEATVLDAPRGGVIGQAPGRRIDLGVRAVAERAVEELGGQVRELWAP